MLTRRVVQKDYKNILKLVRQRFFSKKKHLENYGRDAIVFSF